MSYLVSNAKDRFSCDEGHTYSKNDSLTLFSSYLQLDHTDNVCVERD